MSLPFILCPHLCMENSDPANGYILSTIFFVSGIVTLLQSTFGVRLVHFRNTTNYKNNDDVFEKTILMEKLLNIYSDCQSSKAEHSHFLLQLLRYWQFQNLVVQMILIQMDGEI